MRVIDKIACEIFTMSSSILLKTTEQIETSLKYGTRVNLKIGKVNKMYWFSVSKNKRMDRTNIKMSSQRSYSHISFCWNPSKIPVNLLNWHQLVSLLDSLPFRIALWMPNQRGYSIWPLSTSTYSPFTNKHTWARKKKLITRADVRTTPIKRLCDITMNHTAFEVLWKVRFSVKWCLIPLIPIKPLTPLVYSKRPIM